MAWKFWLQKTIGSWLIDGKWGRMWCRFDAALMEVWRSFLMVKNRTNRKAQSNLRQTSIHPTSIRKRTCQKPARNLHEYVIKATSQKLFVLLMSFCKLSYFWWCRFGVVFIKVSCRILTCSSLLFLSATCRKLAWTRHKNTTKTNWPHFL